MSEDSSERSTDRWNQARRASCFLFLAEELLTSRKTAVFFCFCLKNCWHQGRRCFCLLLFLAEELLTSRKAVLLSSSVLGWRIVDTATGVHYYRAESVKGLDKESENCCLHSEVDCVLISGNPTSITALFPQTDCQPLDVSNTPITTTTFAHKRALVRSCLWREFQSLQLQFAGDDSVGATLPSTISSFSWIFCFCFC